MERLNHEPIVYRVYDEMKNHVGKENAITAEELSAYFDISERKLRDIIKTIRRSRELEKVIGSYNGGYFICTKQEVERANNRLLSQAFSLLKTANANEKKAGMNGQMKLKLGNFYKDTYESLGE